MHEGPVAASANFERVNARRAFVGLVAVAAIGGALFFGATAWLARAVITSSEEPRTPKGGNYEPVARDLALLAQTEGSTLERRHVNMIIK